MSTPSFIKTSLASSLLAAVGFAQAGVQLNLTNQVVQTTGGTNVAVTPGATGAITNETGTGTYRRTDTQPTGTGYIDPFVRVGMQGSAGKDIVQAYNTTVNGVLNNSNEDNWNHAVQYGQVQLQTVGGSSVMRFLLDINQNSGGIGELLNLDDVQIFISTDANQSVTTFDANGLLQLTNSTLVYRMDGLATDADTKVTLDYSINSGSGSGDMYLDIAQSEFASAFTAGGYNTNTKKNNAYIYLYSKFGSNPYTNNDGFEEWAFLAKAVPDGGGGFSGGVPEPSTLLLAGLGILAARRFGPKTRLAV